MFNAPIELTSESSKKKKAKSMGDKVVRKDYKEYEFLQKRDEEKNDLEEDLVPGARKSIWEVILSRQFMLIYLIALIKTSSNFYFNCEIKVFGLFYIENDKSVTNIVCYGIFVSIFMRLGMGYVYKLLGLKMTYFMNLVFEMLTCYFLYFWGHFQLGFFLFVISNRVSAGKWFGLSNASFSVHSEFHDLY